MTQPRGKIRLQLQRLDWAPRTNALFVPRLEQLKLDARLDREAVHLESLSLLLNGQSVSASGELPLPSAFWADLTQNGLMPDWTRSRGRLAVKGAALPALTDFLPDKTITEGRIDLAVAWEPGPKIQGQVTLDQAATRPIDPLGPIRDLNATVKFENRTATVENLVATVGGARLKGAGSVSFDDQFRPRFDCTLQGTNVPLVRTVGLIVRSDVDLRLLSTGARPPTVSGQLLLRDSLYLQDLDLSALGSDAQTIWLPSHLRIGQKPFKDWTLDVNVSGVQFLRLRTPILTGAVSANFHLENNLGDPLAIGQASLASGRITFPFGALKIDSGFVYLSHEAAQRPRLAVNASGICYGYAIKVEISGPATAPEVLFSSTPPLSSSQILSLLTSGQLPGDTGVLNRTARAERLAMFLGNDVISRFLGNEPVQERLTINSGQRISQSGKATYSVEYRLNNRWSLVGEYDQFDTLNAHVKWKIYSK
jgi:translocation and assembly module TamB